MYSEHVCYPEEVEEQMAKAEYFRPEPGMSLGQAFAALDRWRVKQAYPNLSDAERARINPLELRTIVPGSNGSSAPDIHSAMDL